MEAMDGQDLEGRSLKVNEAQRGGRGGGGGRGEEGGRGGANSHSERAVTSRRMGNGGGSANPMGREAKYAAAARHNMMETVAETAAADDAARMQAYLQRKAAREKKS
jgi:hypothetical protein